MESNNHKVVYFGDPIENRIIKVISMNILA